VVIYTPAIGNFAKFDEIGARMQEDANQVTCDEFQRRLCELLASDKPIEEHPHYKTCMICRCLVRNFEQMIENSLGERPGTDNGPEPPPPTIGPSPHESLIPPPVSATTGQNPKIGVIWSAA
jgi:hypothetical protein